MSRASRLLFFLAATATLATIATAAAASAVPVAAAEAAPSVARPLPGLATCSAVLSAAVAAADLEVAAAGRARNNNASSSNSGRSSGSSAEQSAPYSKTLLANGDFLLETHWQTWECMNGIRARSFLTLRPFPAAARRRDGNGKGGDGDSDSDLQLEVLDCSTVDAGIEIDDRAFRESELPSVAEVDACRPRFCVGASPSSSSSSEGNNNNTAGAEREHACEGPYLRTYLESPASGSPFAPFKAIQLDYEPLGHAPHGIYSDPHFDFHFYYTPREEVEKIERGGCGVGFLSPASWKRALAPVPLKCFPGSGSAGAWTNVGLAVNGMGNHIVNLLSPEFGRLPMRGFGSTLLFAKQGSYDGKINFIEMMASRRWLEANAKRLKENSQEQQQQQQQQQQNGTSPLSPPPSLCWDVVGSPTAWPTAGYKPQQYCFEPGTGEKEGGGKRNTSRIRWSRNVFYDAEPECSSVSASTVFAPRSYAPPQKEAQQLNPLCRHDERPGSVFVSTYERAVARGEGHSSAVAEAAGTKALLARSARERAEGSREFLKRGGVNQGEVSQTNSDPVRFSEQLESVAEVVEHAMG